MFRQLSQLILQTPRKVIHLSYWRFAFWWGLILSVHVVTCSFNAFYAYGYWKLSGTYLGVCLDFYQIGMPEPNHRTISAVHGIVAFIHGLCIVFMLGGSLLQRSLAFTLWSSSKAINSVKTERTNSSKLSGGISRAYGKIMYPFALCGVNGKYFDVALVCREIVETALQTVQAYRMSVLLPRTLLNRFYVILLAANCWSSIVADSVFFGRDEARRRFACIVLDCILDLFASTGVQLLVMANYVAGYNYKLKGFDASNWYDDEWVARALNEFRMVVVVSWSDLLSRTIFSLGLVITTTSMKRLLWCLPRNVNRVTHSTASIVLAVEATKKFLSRKKDKIQGPNPVEGLIQQEDIRSKSHRAHGDRIILRSMHLLFGAWGVLILGFHIHSSVQPTLTQCFMQVRPWAVSRPSCYLVGLDCHILNISGEKQQVQVLWAEFDASTVVQVLIRHCPGLEIPDIISEFIAIHGIKLYNSTILEWGESAALTNARHPYLAALFFARVNMTDGLLPIGLHSPDFPPSLTDIEFCVTNLQSLPDNLSTKWPHGGVIYLEHSQLTTLPHELVLLDPGYLSVAGNPITEIASEIFQIPSLKYFSVSDTKLKEFPRDVTHLGDSLVRMYLVDTEIAFFWLWMDHFVERSKGKKVIQAANSDYCKDFEKIQTGETDSFRVPNSLEYSSKLMNPSQENREAILATVDCKIYTDSQFYPLSFEDKINAISIPPINKRQ